MVFYRVSPRQGYDREKEREFCVLCCLILFRFCILMFTPSRVVLLKQLEKPTTEKKSFVRRDVKFILNVNAMSKKSSVPSLEEMFKDQSSCLHFWKRIHIIICLTISDAT